MKQFIIGVPRECKEKEGRVGITPNGVIELRRLGENVEVWVELGAGRAAGFSDKDYLDAGANVISTAAEIYATSDIVVKVKEPTPPEYENLALLKGRTLFAYLHLAGVDRELTEVLIHNRIIAIAYENVEQITKGKITFPLLVPMSRIAGTQAMRQANELCCTVPNRSLVILGGGNVGEAALKQAISFGVSTITVFELNRDRVLQLRRKYGTKNIRIFTIASLYKTVGTAALRNADVVISGVMNPGGSEAPKVLSAKEVALMKEGAFVIDVAIDQGGSTAYSRPTYPGEFFEEAGVFFSCVANIPGSTVPEEATTALTDATMPYVKLLVGYTARYPYNAVWWLLYDHLGLRKGLQTLDGNLVNQFVASRHQLSSSYKPLETFF
jgi:alanine dehydrogenase